MGYWDGTCMLSHLPIVDGDPIRAVFLIETSEEPERDAGGFCSADDLWTPAFPPVPCVYDGYGGAAELPRGQWQTLLRAAFRGSGFVDERAFFPEKANVDTCSAVKLFHVAERGALRLRGVRVRRVVGGEKRTRKIRRVGFALLRAGIYDALVGARTVLHAQADAYVDWLLQPGKLPAEPPPETPPHAHWMSLMRMGMPSVRPFVALHHALVSQRPAERRARAATTREVMHAAVDLAMLNGLLAGGRLHWGPSAGKGSQDRETFVQRALAQATLAEADRIDAEEARMEAEMAAEAARDEPGPGGEGEGAGA